MNQGVEITDQGLATRQLRALNQTLEAQVAERTHDRNSLWQLSSDIMLRCDFEGRIAAVNPAWQAVLGSNEAELVGSNLFGLIHPDDMERTAVGARELSQGIGHARFDNRYRHRDGSYRWISWSTRAGNGLINAVGRDFTDERDKAEALQAAEEALRQSQKMEAVGQLTDLKVLFITGYAENAVLSHGHLEPGMHVLTKPFAIEALASRINELIADG